MIFVEWRMENKKFKKKRKHHHYQQQQSENGRTMYGQRRHQQYRHNDYGNENGNSANDDCNNNVDEDDLLWNDEIDEILIKGVSYRYGEDNREEEEAEDSSSSSPDEGSDDGDNGEKEGHSARYPRRYDGDNHDYENDHEEDNESCASSASTSSSTTVLSYVMSVQSVIDKIEEFILQTVIEPLTEEPNPSLPEIDVDNPATGFRRKLLFNHLTQARSLTSILMVASFCHDLLAPSLMTDNEEEVEEQRGNNYNDNDTEHTEQGSCHLHHSNHQKERRRGRPRRTTTIREVYYFFVTHFRNQRECDKAIWDLVSILNLPSRQSLGLVASPKGWFCGSIDVYNGHTNELKFNGRELDTHGMAITPSTYDNDYITYNGNNKRGPTDNDNDSGGNSSNSIRIESDARCILVIEKEGIYTRLSEDKFFLRYLPCILVTGKGFPDIATRRWVRRMQKTLKIPVYGLCDCNPYGVSVLDTYRYDKGVKLSNADYDNNKRKDDDDNKEDLLEMKWIGLRPSQVETMNLPSNVFQELTNNDKKRLDSLLISSKSKSRGTSRRSKTASNNKNKFFAEQGRQNKNEKVRELQAMYKYKVELEALHWKGMDFLCQFVYETILEQEKVQQSKQQEIARRRQRQRRRRGNHSDSDSSESSNNDGTETENGDSDSD